MSKYSGQIRCKKFCVHNAAKARDEFRLAPVRYTTFDRNYFVAIAAADAGITEEQMSAALRAYQTQFDQLLLNGHSIELAGLGNFRLSMSFRAKEEIADVNIEDCFQRLRVVLRCSKELRDDMKGISHIVDPLQVAASGNAANRQHFYLNYQLPTQVTLNLQTRLCMYCSEGLPNLSSLGDLYFVVDHPDYGSVTLTYLNTSPATPTFVGEAPGGHEFSIAFISESDHLRIDEFIGFGDGAVLKAFGGR